jgi:hypothetical protein
VVALVLESLELVDEGGERLAVEGRPSSWALIWMVALAGHLRHHEPGAVAHRLGVDVLVGVLRGA